MSDRSAQTHLLRRNAVYYFRARIPRDLQSYLGKREEKFSLRTKDLRESKRLVRHASAEFMRRCARLRSTLQAWGVPRDPEVIDEMLVQA